MAADEDIDHLRQHDRDQTGGGRLQVERIERSERRPIPPTGRVQDEEEASQRTECFERTEKQIGTRQQCRRQQPLAARTRRPIHDLGMGPLGAQRQCRKHVCAEVDGKDLDHRQRQGNAQQHIGQVRNQLGDVRSQNVGEELADVVEHRASFLDGIDDGGEMVVKQDDVGRLARHIGTGQAHGNADVGNFQRRCVVHPVTSDGDDLALALQRLDDQHLLLGGDAGKQHLGRIERELQFRGTHLAHRLAAQHRRMRSAHDVDFARQGQRRMRMVAGHHDDAQARCMTAIDRLMHIGTRRILKADQATQLQRLLARIRDVRERLPGQRQHTQATVGHVLVGAVEHRPGRVVERPRLLALVPRLAQRQDDFRCALAPQKTAATDRTRDHRHAPPLGVEGNLADALAEFGNLPGKLPQRHFHRVTARLPTGKFQVVTEARDGAQPQVQAARPAFRGKPVAAGNERLAHRHAILRQRASLVRQDHRRAAQSLDGSQMPHQRIAPRHALRGQSQRQRHRRQQTFRHVGDDDADGEHEARPERQTNETADDEEQYAEPHRQHRHQSRDPADLLLQRRLRFAGRLRQMRDAAKLGVHARRMDDGTALAGDNKRAGQQQAARGERINRRRRLALGAARLGQRLASQRGQIDAQPPAFEDAAIRRHLGPFGQQHDIARHQPGGIDLLGTPVAADIDLLRQEQPQRRQGLLGAVGLPEGKAAIDEDDANNGPAELRHALTRLELFGQKRQAGRQPEHDGKEMDEFAQ